jgi:hypothetical protein
MEWTGCVPLLFVINQTNEIHRIHIPTLSMTVIMPCSDSFDASTRCMIVRLIRDCVGGDYIYTPCHTKLVYRAV